MLHQLIRLDSSRNWPKWNSNILKYNFGSRNVWLVGTFPNNNEYGSLLGYLLKLQFKYFEIKLFHATVILLWVQKYTVDWLLCQTNCAWESFIIFSKVEIQIVWHLIYWSTVHINEMRLVRSTQSFGHGHHFDIKGQVQGDVILIPYLPIHIGLVHLPTKHKGIGS
jgi:hypothetical protein